MISQGPLSGVVVLAGPRPTRERLANHSRISAVPASPERIADHRHTITAGDFVLRRKCAATRRLRAQDLEQARGDHLASQRHGLLSGIVHGEALALKRREILERRLLRAPVVEVRRGHITAAQAFAGRVGLLDDHQPIGLIERHASKRNRVDDRIDGRRRANAKHQDDERNGGERGRGPQRADGEPQVREHGSLDAAKDADVGWDRDNDMNEHE